MKAKVIKFSYAGQSLQGLLLPNGERRLGLSQAADLNLIPPNRSLKQLEAMTGIAFPSHQKVKSDLHASSVNSISLDDFMLVVRWADQKGNELAKAIIDASLIQTINNAFDVALGIEKTNRDLVQDFNEMIASKRARRNLTDTWKECYSLTGEFPSYGKHTLMLYERLDLVDSYEVYKDTYNKAERLKFPFRHHFLNQEDRFRINDAETNIFFMIERLGMSLEDAIAKI